MNKIETINKIVDEFKLIFPTVTIPPIVWNNSMRTTAGRVKVCRRTRIVKIIELNPHLLQNDTDLDQTLMHELCHVADYILYNKLGHGPTWRHCMVKVGRQVKRCHNYNTTGLKRRHKRHPAKCSCRTYELTSQRVKKMLIGYKYRCQNCHSHLELTQTESQDIFKLVEIMLKF